MADVGGAIERRDAAAVARVAHTLRGSCGSIGASSMADVVGRLEDRSRSGEWDAMEELYRHLERRTSRSGPSPPPFESRGPDGRLTPSPTSTVLLVDDDPVALSLLSALVTGMEGTDVITFRDPLEAMAWCKLHPADLVITDQQMPGLSGTELIRALRADPRYEDVPLLMITTVQDRDVRREAVLLGANDYLSKPLDPVEVGARIRNMLALRRSTQSLARYAASLEEEVRKATAEITTREHEAIVRLARATEYRDWETGAHIVRVAWYARIMARNLRLSEASRMPSSGPPRCTTWARSACPTTSCSSPARSMTSSSGS